MNFRKRRLVAAELFSPLLASHAAIPSAIAFWRSWKSIVIDTILARATSPHEWLSTISFTLSLVLNKSRMVQARSSGKSVSILRYPRLTPLTQDLQCITYISRNYRHRATSKRIVLYGIVSNQIQLDNLYYSADADEKYEVHFIWWRDFGGSNCCMYATSGCMSQLIDHAQKWSTWTSSMPLLHLCKSLPLPA